RIVAAEDGSKHHRWVDRDQRGRAARRSDQIPCHTLGQSLGPCISANVGVVEVSPNGFVADAFFQLGTSACRRHRRRQDDTLHALPYVGFNNASGAVAGWSNKRIGVFRLRKRNRGCYVEHETATACSHVPP